MTDAEIIEKLKAALGGKIAEISNPGRRRLFMKIAPSDLPAVTKHLRDEHGVVFLSTISGLDIGEAFELIYHFSTPETDFNLRTEIPRADPRIESISPLIPGAILYERELQDMFGIVVDNIPDPRRVILPDDWPEGQYPLRKDWKHERPAEVIPGGES